MQCDLQKECETYCANICVESVGRFCNTICAESVGQEEIELGFLTLDPGLAIALEPMAGPRYHASPSPLDPGLALVLSLALAL